MLGKLTKRFLASLLAVSMILPGSAPGTLQVKAEETTAETPYFVDVDDAEKTTTGESMKIQYSTGATWKSAKKDSYASILYNSSETYSDTAGTEYYYTMNFTGSGVQIFATTNTKHADCDVYIDGEYVGDLIANRSKQQKQLVFEVFGLENKEHILKVSRKANDANCMQLDMIRVYQADVVNFVDIDDALSTTVEEPFKITYLPAGAWTATNSHPELYYDATEHYTQASDGSLSYEMVFSGTGVAISASLSSKHANCDVYIDDVFSGEMITYTSGDKQHKQILFETYGLEDGEHTLRVSKKAGDNKALQLDKIRVFYNTLELNKIILNAKEIRMPVGGERQMSAISAPWMIPAEVVWSSEDETVATVDENGLIKAVATEEAETIVTAAVVGTELREEVKVVVDPKETAMVVTVGDEKLLDTQREHDEILAAEPVRTWEGTAWKGDTINSKVIVAAKDSQVAGAEVTASDFTNENGDVLSADNIRIKWLKEIEVYNGKGNKQGELLSYPDIIHKGGETDIDAGTLKFAWMSIHIPEDTKAGTYTGTIFVNNDETIEPVELAYTVKVIDLVQPELNVTDIQFWQHPFSVANYYLGLGENIKIGSVCKESANDFYFTEQHLNLMRAEMIEYASMGGHDLVATIVEEAWNHQSFYGDPSMIKWTKNADGTWTYDYTWFDIWVEFAIECGVIDPAAGLGQIKCYSVVPWGNYVTFYDEASASTVKKAYTPGNDNWKEIWTPFLIDFMAHTKEKGWFDITYISMDERTLDQLEPTVELIESLSDENGEHFNISSCLNYSAPEYYDFTDHIDDISVGLKHTQVSTSNALEDHRREIGLKTTYYTCTGDYPSNFIISDPGDNYWNAWYTMTLGTDGYLRWAWDNYLYDMHRNVSYKAWEPGDCWFIYPLEREEVDMDGDCVAGFYSTPRYEMLKQGLRDVAKADYLMKQKEELNAALDELTLSIERPQKGSLNGSSTYANEAERASAAAKAVSENAEAVSTELAEAKTARYVKIDGTGVIHPNNETIKNLQLNEVMVYGAEIGNVAFDKPIATSEYASTSRLDVHANDGDRATYWDAGQYADRPWIIIDLEGIYEVDSINVVNYYSSARFYQYEVYTSVDGVEYTLAAQKTDRKNATEDGTTYIFEEPLTAAYVKFVGTHNSANGSFHFNELRVYGELKEAVARKTRVACVGDSLTEGMTSSGGLKGSTAYPAYLQQLLGEDYRVENFGKSSMTLLKNTDKSYWNTTEFTDSLTFEPDVVLIMLGTNDSKEKYWNEDAFRADAKALVEEYQKLSTNPRIIFAVSPQCFIETGTDITAAGVERMVEVQRALIEENGWETVDMYTMTEGKQALYNTDKLHFTDSGYYYLAQCMYCALTGEALKDPSDASRDIPVEALKVSAVDSQTGEGAERVLDGNYATLWHTAYYGTSRANHWIQFEVAENYTVDGLRYQPRQSGRNGIITAYEVLVSNDGEEWTSVAEGSWNKDSLWKLAEFEAQKVKYVRLVAKDSHSDNSYVFASAAEIRLLGAEVETPVDPPVQKEEVCEVFPDVTHGEWYEEAIQYVYDKGIMSGSNGFFRTQGEVTRAQVIATLYNMEGKPEVKDYAAVDALKDVKAGQWYTDAICWAYNTGVASGSNGKFNVGADVTRQQLAMMLYNYADYKGFDTTANGDYSKLEGANEVASYAVTAMKWAYGTGLINGNKTTVNGVTVYNLNPAGTATRAQMASIMKNFCEGNQI